MKKKIFAALCAALIACTALCAPASAASKYQKGDVNMDGKIDVVDAMLILQEYVQVGLCYMPVSFTEEQLELATITGIGIKGLPYGEDVNLPFTNDDAQVVLTYYVCQIVGKDVPDIETYAKDLVKYYDYDPEPEITDQVIGEANDWIKSGS